MATNQPQNRQTLLQNILFRLLLGTVPPRVDLGGHSRAHPRVREVLGERVAQCEDCKEAGARRDHQVPRVRR
jgi:hypothetical protein